MIFYFLAFRNLKTRYLVNSANLVTTIRLGVVLFLAVTGLSSRSSIIVGGGIFLLIADSLDGWLARRRGMHSEFGEFLDKETDAYFMMVLCLLLVLKGLVGAWVLIIGFLRYFFVVFIF